MLKALTTGPFTGRHIAAILIAFFALVIAVNVLMARDAITTFSGEVVENSYVASQKYNGWLHEAAREKALGWQAIATRHADGRVAVSLGGAPGAGITMSAVARHPLGSASEQTLGFARAGELFVSSAPLAAGRWTLRIEAHGQGQDWHGEVPLQ